MKKLNKLRALLRKVELCKFVENSHGVALIQVIVAGAMSAVISLALLKVNETNLKTINKTETDKSLEYFFNGTLRATLGRSENCMASFGALDVSGANAVDEILEINDITSCGDPNDYSTCDNKVLMNVTNGDPLNLVAQGDWRVVSMNHSGFSAIDVGSLEGRCNLEVVFARNRKMSFGSTEVTKNIEFFCQVQLADPSRLNNCVASSDYNEGIWDKIVEPSRTYINYKDDTASLVSIGPIPRDGSDVIIAPPDAPITVYEDSAWWKLPSFRQGVNIPKDSVYSFSGDGSWGLSEVGDNALDCLTMFAFNSIDIAVYPYVEYCFKQNTFRHTVKIDDPVNGANLNVEYGNVLVGPNHTFVYSGGGSNYSYDNEIYNSFVTGNSNELSGQNSAGNYMFAAGSNNKVHLSFAFGLGGANWLADGTHDYKTHYATRNMFSAAIGGSNYVQGFNSYALGFGNKADTVSTFLIGKYNNSILSGGFDLVSDCTTVSSCPGSRRFAFGMLNAFNGASERMFAIGRNNIVETQGFAFGKFGKIGPSGTGAMVISNRGSGLGGDRLVEANTRNLMLFHSDGSFHLSNWRGGSIHNNTLEITTHRGLPATSLAGTGNLIYSNYNQSALTNNHNAQNSIVLAATNRTDAGGGTTTCSQDFHTNFSAQISSSRCVNFINDINKDMSLVSAVGAGRTTIKNCEVGCSALSGEATISSDNPENNFFNFSLASRANMSNVKSNSFVIASMDTTAAYPAGLSSMVSNGADNDREMFNSGVIGLNHEMELLSGYNGKMFLNYGLGTKTRVESYPNGTGSTAGTQFTAFNTLIGVNESATQKLTLRGGIGNTLIGSQVNASSGVSHSNYSFFLNFGNDHQFNGDLGNDTASHSNTVIGGANLMDGTFHNSLILGSDMNLTSNSGLIQGDSIIVLSGLANWGGGLGDISFPNPTESGGIYGYFQGGYKLYSNVNHAQNVYIPAGGAGWNPPSSRFLKDRNRPIDGLDHVERLRSFEVMRWSYDYEKDLNLDGELMTHIGPFAQDFYRAFGLGGSDKTITPLDVSGVAMRGLQEIHKNTLIQKQDVWSLQSIFDDISSLAATIFSELKNIYAALIESDDELDELQYRLRELENESIEIESEINKIEQQKVVNND